MAVGDGQQHGHFSNCNQYRELVVKKPRKIFGSKTVIALVSAFLVFLGLAVSLVAFQPETRWRAKVVQLKLSGDLPSVEFPWLLKMLIPGSPIYLEGLASTGSPYAAIRNPQDSKDDTLAGGQLFQSHCSSCHSDDAHGSSLSLFDGVFASGDSDWAVFRNTVDGIEGTGMPAMNLPEKSIWQTIAYMRQRSTLQADSNDYEASDFQMLEPVTFDRIMNRPEEPNNWLSYSGTLDGQRFSRLHNITRDNIAELKLAWVYQGGSHDHDVESTPIVVDGIMITTEPPGTVLALNAETGRVLWRYNRKLPSDLRICCGPVNRGVAIANSSVFVGTLDAHLVALDIRSGKVIWDAETAPHSDGYSNTAAPLVVKDSVIVGVAGGEYGIRGFVDAYDISTGERKWRFNTIPAEGDDGSETWSGDSWMIGGGPTWMTGTFDIDSNLTYWGVGNPGPDFNNANRKGDNLYTNSIVALDADSGALRWYFQFTPEDVHDFDANSIPIVAELPIAGKRTKVIMIATKNGFFYVLDAITGRFISALEVARQTWALEIDKNGRPIRDPAATPSPEGTRVHPGAAGGPNWFPPSFNPVLNLFYVPVAETGAVYFSSDQSFKSGESYIGGSTSQIPGYPQYTVLRAIDPIKNERLWEFRGASERVSLRTGGTFATTAGLVFWGDSNFLIALDSSSGQELWRANVGGQIVAAPITYSVSGKQYVAVSAGRGLFVFGL